MSRTKQPGIGQGQAGGQVTGEQHYAAKITAATIPEIRALLRAGVKGTEIAQRYGVSKGVISDINRGRSWRHVPA